MRKSKLLLRWAALPISLLAMLGGVSWYNDHRFPAITPGDAKVRAQLSGTKDALAVTQWQVSGAGGRGTITLQPMLTISAPADKADLVAHLWIDPNATGAGVTTGRQTEIHFPLPNGRGQASIYLGETAAADSILISHWVAYEPGFDGGPPITGSEEQYALDRASGRYFRRWLARRGVNCDLR